MIGVGMKLYGYCNGFFGCDSYGVKTVEAIGCDWVVVREENGSVNMASFPNNWRNSMEILLKEWSVPQ